MKTTLNSVQIRYNCHKSMYWLVIGVTAALSLVWQALEEGSSVTALQ